MLGSREVDGRIALNRCVTVVNAAVEAEVRLGRGRVRVPAHDRHAARDELVDQLERPRQLGRQRHLGYRRRVEQPAQQRQVRRGKSRGSCTPARRGDRNGPSRCAPRTRAPMPVHGHRAQRVQQRGLRRGHERRLERRRPRRQQRLPHAHVPLVVGGHQVNAREPVDLQVDESRRGDPAPRAGAAHGDDRSAVDLHVARHQAPSTNAASTPSFKPCAPRSSPVMFAGAQPSSAPEATTIRRKAVMLNVSPATGVIHGRDLQPQLRSAHADTSSMFRSRLVLIATLVAALAPAVFVALKGTQPMMMSGAMHFGLVSAVAGLTSIASVALSVAGARAGDGRTILMGIAFSTMTALFAVHALATPGMMVGQQRRDRARRRPLGPGRRRPAGADRAAALRRPRRVRPLLIAQAAIFAAVVGAGIYGLAHPNVVPAVPKAKSGPAIGLLVAGGGFLAILVVRALRTFLLTRRCADLTVALGCCWIGVTLYANLVVGVDDARLLRRPPPGDRRRRPDRHPGRAGHQARRRLAPARRRPHGHRTGRLRGGLPRPARARPDDAARQPRRLDRGAHPPRRSARRPRRRGAQALARARRNLAVGGLLHDIGKLAVPLEILQKPGSLTDDEFVAIKRHPGDGRKLLDELGGFSEAIRGLVSDHHERLDGSGYPRGLKAGDMSLETRILAVCDVYDALVSDRVYRPAWTAERALALLQQESEAYDATVVGALQNTLAGATSSPATGWVADLGARALEAARPSGGAPRAV